jgi:Fungal Zn(2)-Cys(6) binuclear cluster domain
MFQRPSAHFLPTRSVPADMNYSDNSVHKRKRVTQACDSCNRKKIKCDGKRPTCSHCANSNAQCTYQRALKKRGPRAGYIEELENRVNELENMLASTGDVPLTIIAPPQLIHPQADTTRLLEIFFSTVNPRDVIVHSSFDALAQPFLRETMCALAARHTGDRVIAGRQHVMQVSLAFLVIVPWNRHLSAGAKPLPNSRWHYIRRIEVHSSLCILLKLTIKHSRST